MAVNGQTSARHGSKRLNVNRANTSRCRRSANDPGDRLPDEQGSAQGHRIFCSGPSRGMRKNRCPSPGRALKMPERGAARPRPPISQMMDFIRCPTAHVYMRKRGGKPRITWGRANLPGAAVCPVCYPAGHCPLSRPGIAAGQVRCGLERQDRWGLEGRRQALRCAQDLARPATRGQGHGLRHPGTADARPGDQGVVRGKRIITTNPDTSQPCPDDIGVFSQKKGAFGAVPVHSGSTEQAYRLTGRLV